MAINTIASCCATTQVNKQQDRVYLPRRLLLISYSRSYPSLQILIKSSSENNSSCDACTKAWHVHATAVSAQEFVTRLGVFDAVSKPQEWDLRALVETSRMKKSLWVITPQLLLRVLYVFFASRLQGSRNSPFSPLDKLLLKLWEVWGLHVPSWDPEHLLCSSFLSPWRCLLRQRKKFVEYNVIITLKYTKKTTERGQLY